MKSHTVMFVRAHHRILTPLNPVHSLTSNFPKFLLNVIIPTSAMSHKQYLLQVPRLHICIRNLSPMQVIYLFIYVYKFFVYAACGAGCVTSNWRITGGWGIKKNVEGSRCGIMWGAITLLSWKNWGKLRSTTARTVCVLARIQIGHLPNTQFRNLTAWVISLGPSCYISSPSQISWFYYFVLNWLCVEVYELWLFGMYC